ncbi:MAG: hypothetical protein NTY17_08880 [Planctomycetia bacterium]|nr:hypothetical protein [Planctomycetia bacterium]
MASGSWESRADRIASVVARVRLRMVAVALAAGLLLAVAAAIAWVVAGVLLDLAAPLSVPLRVAAVCTWWAVVAAAGAAFVLLPAVRRPLLDTVSLRIENALGGIHNRLLTVVDLARGGHAGRTLEPEMVERLLAQTQTQLSGFRPSRVVRWQALARNAALAAGAAAMVAALWLALGERLTITLDRFLHPTADIPPATWLQLRSPGDIETLEGEPLEIEGRVVRSSVEDVDLVIFDAAGQPHRHPMRRTTADTFVAAIDGLEHAATYRLEGGGTWTKTHAITLLQRPEIMGLTRLIRLPDYMRIDTPLPVADDARRIEAPETSTVEFVAEVSADAVDGSLHLSERTLETRDVERFDERVWFEDDLPRDAVSETPWKWTTTHAAGGLRSFTFGFDGRPFGMKTRLEPLVLPQDLLPQRSLMLMARLEPADPPTHLAMLLEQEKIRLELVWGDADAVPPAKGVLRVVAGPLPPPGEWVRLMAPLASLPQLVGRPVTGVAFSVDRGRLQLDRPGWVDRSTQSVQQPVDQPIGELPVQRCDTHAAAVAAQSWIGGVLVEKPVWATIGFTSAAGHASLPMPAVEIAPTIDRPPSIVVDDPPANLTLQVADDVEIRGQAFDDWGLDRISVRIGPDARHLADPVPLAGVVLADRPPDTQATLSSVLTMEQLGIAPGKSAAWSLVVRDTKGQQTESKVFQIGVVLPPEMALARTQVPALEQARREAEQAARAAEQQAATLDEKRAAVMQAVGEEPLAAIDAAEEAQEQAQAQQQAQQQSKEAAPPDNKPEPDPKLAAAVKEKTAAAQKTADEAARSLEQPRKNDLAAVDAALEQRSREAQQLAKSLTQAADQAAQSPLVPQAQKDQLAKLAAEAEAVKDSLARNEAFKGDTAKLDRMADAPPQAAVAEQAHRLEEALKDVEQRLNEAGAAKRLETLSKDLDRRSQSLAALPKQPAASEAAREQVEQVQDILGTPQAEARQAATDAVEAAAEAAAEAGHEAADLAAQLAGRKPVSPPRAAPSENGQPADARPQDSPKPADTPAAPAAKPDNPSAAPSQMAAESSADAVESMLESPAVQQALGMAERARRLEERAAREAARQAAQQAAANKSQPAQPAPRQGEMPGDPSEMQKPGEAKAQLTDGGAMAGKAEVADPLRGLDASRRAAIYKLPPRVRDPLLEGMRQRGPAAYQDVIDTYFRQLGRDIPQ